MTVPLPTTLRFRTSLLYMVSAGLLAAGVGAWPTWRLAGSSGLLTKAVAGLIVLGVMSASAAAVVAASRRGVARAAYAFLLGGVVRLLLCLGLSAGAWLAFDLRPRVLLLWTALFYAAMLFGEGLWLAGAMRGRRVPE